MSMGFDPRVIKGVAYLNERYGTTWPDQIVWAGLDISDTGVCLGGQLEGSYNRFLENNHDLDPYDTTDFGFDLIYFATREDVANLNNAWKTWAESYYDAKG